MFITFDYRCIEEDCPAKEKKEERTHRKDEKQFCNKCNQEMQKLACGPSGQHVSWSTWRI